MKSCLYLSVLCLFSCASLPKKLQTPAQGVSGKVSYSAGNQMPSPDSAPKKEPTGVLRWLYIYELTLLNQVSGQAPMYTSIRSKLVTRVKSDASGNFLCSLRPGKYSLFVGEGNNFFANQTNRQGAVAAFEVKPGIITQFNVLINHKAFY